MGVIRVGGFRFKHPQIESVPAVKLIKIHPKSMETPKSKTT